MADNKRAYNEVEAYHHYEIPNYKIVDGKGIEENGTVTTIKFVRGSKISGENKTEPLDGTLHEHLLSVMINDLKLKSQEFPSRETSLAITHLEDAQHWLEERVKAREAQGVLGTYRVHKS